MIRLDQNNTVEISLDEIVELLKLGVRRTAAFMGMGVNAALDPEFKKVSLPKSVSNIHLLPEALSEGSIQNIKNEFKVWIEAAGLRELCESIEGYLTAIYRCAFLFRASEGGRISSGTVIELPPEFERKGLRVKLKILQDEFGVAPSHPEHLASLWSARNCLTHRRGVVGDNDLDVSGQLTIKWLGFDAIYIDNKGNEFPIRHDSLPLHTGEGGHVGIRVAERIRSFERGSRVGFSAHDLAELCWFTLSQSDGIIKTLMDYGSSKGIPIRTVPAAAAETTGESADL